jgi:DNA polymerase III delta subunit
MQLKIYHGEHIVSSRKKLLQDLDDLKSKHIPVSWLNGAIVKIVDLELAIQSQELFATEKAVVLENLHKNTKTTASKAALTYLKDLFDTSPANPTHIYIWEQRTLTATMLKNFPTATVQEFKLKASIFEWLDSFGTPTPAATKLELLNKAKDNEDAFFLFTMLTRQIRLLLMAHQGGTIAGPPFMHAKLKKQAHNFTLQQLLALHALLTKVDINTKRGIGGLSLEQQLDLLTIEV